MLIFVVNSGVSRTRRVNKMSMPIRSRSKHLLVLLALVYDLKVVCALGGQFLRIGLLFLIVRPFMDIQNSFKLGPRLLVCKRF